MIEDQMTPTGVANQPTDEQPAPVAVKPAEETSVAPSPESAAAAPEVQADAPYASEAPEAAGEASPDPKPEAPQPVVPEPEAPVTEVPDEAPAPVIQPDPQETPVGDPVPAEAPVVTPTEAPVQPAPAEVPPAVITPGPQASAEPGPDDSALFEQYMRNLDSEDRGESGGSGTLTRGETIEAEVIQVEDNRVFVNLGTKAEGVVPLEELTDEKVSSAKGLVKPGDRFEVVVLKTSNNEGNPVVSKKKADFDQQWRRILVAQESGEVFRATVVDRVKGGLVVDIGVRGFVPATHVGSGKLRNIEKYVGETISVKIIEVDKERRKVVLSNRMAEEERKEEVKKDLFGKVKVGDILPGTVRRLTDYGAFVDLGGIDGLLHISEMSWMRIDHPQEVLKVGQEINVLVLRLDENTGRISLGLRQVLPDPWSLVKEHYTLGQKIQVKVTRMVQSGAFVRLPEQAEAFLPLSEISDKRLKRPQDALELNQDIEPMIIDLKPEDRRMVLSLRENAVPGSYRGGMDGGMGMGMGMGRGPMQGRRPMGGPPGRGRGRDREPDFDAPNVTTRTPTGGATIGERLGALKGMFKSDAPEPSEDSDNS